VFALRILGEKRAQIEAETQMVLKNQLLGNSAFKLDLLWTYEPGMAGSNRVKLDASI
jgi:hypothetical protein